jgi:hypothetical protein
MEAALRQLDERCRIYQYLVKRTVDPFVAPLCAEPVAQEALSRRTAYLNARRPELYQLTQYVVFLLETTQGQVSTRLRGVWREPREAFRRWLSTHHSLKLLEAEVDDAIDRLSHQAESFESQLTDFGLARLARGEAFQFFRQLVNYDLPVLSAATPSTPEAYLDYFVADSPVDCHRDHLMVGSQQVKVLSMKKPPGQTFAHILGEPKPLPPIDALLESGKVLALNFPVGMNPGLARILGVMLKLDFQRAILQRIPQITAHPQRTWRDLLFVCDEYHAFATVGEVDPTGDERTFALSRQARLIPIVATQSISSLRSALPGDESWRTLLQCFRTKVFLATSDEFTARNAARDRLKAHCSVSESGRDAHISLLTGRPTSATQSLSASKSYAPHHEYIFAPRVFTQLQNAQAIVLPYDGINPLPPQYCYLKPHYLDVQTSYFDHLERGAI